MLWYGFSIVAFLLLTCMNHLQVIPFASVASVMALINGWVWWEISWETDEINLLKNTYRSDAQPHVVTFRMQIGMKNPKDFLGLALEFKFFIRSIFFILSLLGEKWHGPRSRSSKKTHDFRKGVIWNPSASPFYTREGKEGINIFLDQGWLDFCKIFLFLDLKNLERKNNSYEQWFQNLQYFCNNFND